MKYCSNCGNQLDYTGACNECGRRYNEEEPTQQSKQTSQDIHYDAPPSGMAVASLITGIMCFFIGGPILGFIATWLGATAINDYNRHGGSPKTESYARLGRKLGFICIWIWVGFIALYFLVIVVGFSMFRF